MAVPVVHLQQSQPQVFQQHVSAVDVSTPSRSGASRTILFLDVDGVLHSTSRTPATPLFDVRCMTPLARLLQVTGAEIVLSSTWRVSPQAIAQVDEALQKYGVGPIADCTPLRAKKTREGDIGAWLDSHEGEVARWVALDDIDITANSSPEAQRCLGHFVQTKGTVGLTEADVEAVIDMFRNPP